MSYGMYCLFPSYFEKIRFIFKVPTMTSLLASQINARRSGLSIKSGTSGSSDYKVCIIGAGVAGLASAKHLKDQGVSFIVLEASNHVGGTWYYEPRVHTDEFGTPLITSMYKHLRTNLPKVTMTLTGFPMPDDVDSYPPRKHFYDYLVSYSEHFKLENNIQQLHELDVKYSFLTPTNLLNPEYKCNFGEEHIDIDADEIEIEREWLRTIIHSRDYRVPDSYKGKNVLVIGYGPSGNDIGIDVATISKNLFHSHHRTVGTTPYPDNYIMKPDVREFNETGVVFADGTYEDIDDVIYCTGFDFTFPFLDSSSGLTLTPRTVTPLYKLMVNINDPTMLVLGLFVHACIVIGIDAQARYAAALAKGNFTLPSKEEMMREWQEAVDELNREGKPLSDIHYLNTKEDPYYASLAEQSGTERAKPVMAKIRLDSTEMRMANLYTYRNYEISLKDDLDTR